MTKRSKNRKGTPPSRATPAERRRVMAELRAFAHPLRLRIYEAFLEKPRTTMQVAELLGEPPTRLYHHVNALLKTGMLRLRETRPVRGAVEKYFEAVRPGNESATSDVLERSPAARQSARAAAHAVLERARQDLFESMEAPPELRDAGPMLLRMLIGTTPAKAAKIRARLFDLVKEIRKECGEERDEAAPAGSDRERWSVTLAFAPSRSRPEPGERG